MSVSRSSVQADNIAAFRRIIDAFSTADPDVIDELLAPDCIEHQRGNNPGSEGAKEVIRFLHRGMSDFSLTIEDLVADGDMVWTRNRARGVNTGRSWATRRPGRPSRSMSSTSGASRMGSSSSTGASRTSWA